MNKATPSTVGRVRRTVRSAAASTSDVTPVVEPVVSEPVVSEPVVEQVVVESPTESTIDTLRARFDAIVNSKNDQVNQIKKDLVELKKLQKDYDRLVKDLGKKSKKKTPRDPSVVRKPSGFASAVLVSDDLYDFLAQFGVKHGDPIARTDVTRHIASYIKAKDLQNPNYRREIVADETLKKLFGPPIELKDPKDPQSPKVYSYMRLQKYISPHFPKKN